MAFNLLRNPTLVSVFQKLEYYRLAKSLSTLLKQKQKDTKKSLPPVRCRTRMSSRTWFEASSVATQDLSTNTSNRISQLEPGTGYQMDVSLTLLGHFTKFMLSFKLIRKCILSFFLSSKLPFPPFFIDSKDFIYDFHDRQLPGVITDLKGVIFSQG